MPVARPRVGLVANPRSHRNRARPPSPATQVDGVDMMFAEPRTHRDLVRVLGTFAAASIDLLVVDGGDGTLRDVLTAAAQVFRGALPPIALVPSGKTNALAVDLGLPLGWSVHDAIAAASSGACALRSPVEVWREGEVRASHCGFLFGAGGFVRATELAQRTHKAGAFQGIAVGLSLVWSIAQTAFGRADNAWRRGDAVRLAMPGESPRDMRLYLLITSTLERMPLNLRPLGPSRAGMKTLTVDAPPRRLLLSAPAVVAGSRAGWLRRSGYGWHDADRFEIAMDGEFILDGEHYAGGALSVRRGAPLRFVVP